MTETVAPPETDAIHLHFGLSYAQYLVIPRTALQSMPDEWQSKFVKLLEELDEKFAYLPSETSGDDRREYRVVVDRCAEEQNEETGQWESQWQGVDLGDALANYERGRRRLEPRPDC